MIDGYPQLLCRYLNKDRIGALPHIHGSHLERYRAVLIDSYQRSDRVKAADVIDARNASSPVFPLLLLPSQILRRFLQALFYSHAVKDLVSNRMISWNNCILQTEL